MKLTDIDLSSLAEVTAAVSLLEHVRRDLSAADTPLPTLQAGAWLVANPAPVEGTADAAKRVIAAADLTDTETVTLRHGAQSASYSSVDACRTALVADAETRRVDPMDAATVFGGASAQSAAPLPAHSTAGAAQSPIAPAAPPVTGALPTLPALAPTPAASADVHTAPVGQSSPAGAVEVDADGVQWDERIHAGTKRKNADGRWTAKRGPRIVQDHRRATIGTPEMTLAQLQDAHQQANVTPPVQAGLPNLTAATAPAPHVTAAPVDALAPLVAPAQSAAPFHPSSPALSTAPPAALLATSGPASLVAPTQSVHLSGKPAPTTFAEFMTAATVEVQCGRLTALAFAEACKPYGGAAGLASNPSAVPTVWADLKAKNPGMQ